MINILLSFCNHGSRFHMENYRFSRKRSKKELCNIIFKLILAIPDIKYEDKSYGLSEVFIMKFVGL